MTIVSTASVMSLRGSAQKARLIADLIRGRKVGEAGSLLYASKKYASEPMKKLLNSAISNAMVKNPALNPDLLIIKTVFVNEGFRMKRVRPAPMGQAYTVQKRTCHITMQLAEISAVATKE